MDTIEDVNEVLSTNLEEEDSLPSMDDTKEVEEVMKEDDTIDNTILEDNKSKEVMNSIFESFANTEETYSTYSVYILRENETLDEVINKYKTTREELSEYNDLDNLRVGSKLIIPSCHTFPSSTAGTADIRNSRYSRLLCSAADRPHQSSPLEV